MDKNQYYLRFYFKHGMGKSFDYFINCENTHYKDVFDQEYTLMSNSEKEYLITVELYLTDNNGNPVYINNLY